MRLYHGADKIIERPRFGVGKTYNDFGLGFYCTASEHDAACWAVSPGKNGFVSVYAFEETGLRMIDLCSSQYTVLHWLTLLLNYRQFDPATPLLHRASEYLNRNFYLDYQSSDCILGYRADSVNFTLAEMFLNGELSFPKFKSLLTDAPGGRQFVLKSNRSFDRISYVGYMTADFKDIYPGSEISEINRLIDATSHKDKSDLYIDRLIDEEFKSYDARLQ